MSRPDREPRRWPPSVFETGSEPDPRFSLANQRTLLAWIRTALALVLAAAVADTVPLDVPPVLRVGATVLLSVAGAAAAVLGWRSWSLSERALRMGGPLPSSGRAGVLLAAVVMVAAVLVVVVAVQGSVVRG